MVLGDFSLSFRVSDSGLIKGLGNYASHLNFGRPVKPKIALIIY